MTIKRFVTVLLLVALGLVAGRWAYLYSSWWPQQPLPHSEYGSVAEIPLPAGYERLADDGSGYADYLRSLPLAHSDSIVRSYAGEPMDTVQPYCYRLIDLPLIYKFEQCADVCIRLRSEYLYHTRKYEDIHFDDTNYQTLAYEQGNRREDFDEYLKKVELMANTASMKHEMPKRRLEDVRPGDVFVYDAKSRKEARYGHAILVADVAVDRQTGQKIALLIQGSTPACSIHVLRNRQDSILSPWFPLQAQNDTLDFGFARYQTDELYCFDPSHAYGDSLKALAMSALAEGLVAAYPDQHLRYADEKIWFADGEAITFDDGRYKDYEDRLEDADIEDMLVLPYETAGKPSYLADGGRIRCEVFMQKMYGHSEQEVWKRMERVEWFGDQVLFSTVNGASEQLKRVAEELAAYPELLPYLKTAGTYNWRPVRGSNRMSAHSYGTAIDICTEYANYWRWDFPKAIELGAIDYNNRIPMEIVHVFEQHGFVWGGRWYHYDTMHFEYRPEILSLCKK